jgi:hypothetical protein
MIRTTWTRKRKRQHERDEEKEHLTFSPLQGCSSIDMGTLRCFTNFENSVAPSLHRGLPTAVDLIVALPAPIAECIVRRLRSEVLHTPRPA